MASQYRPGSRNPRYRRSQQGNYSERRKAWANTILGQAVMMFIPHREDQKEIGPSIKVLFPQPRARTVEWDLTFLTEAELDAQQKLLNLAFDTARPIVQERDKIANEAYDRGDDSYSRSYRQVPQFIVREGPQSEDSAGVLDGPAAVPSGDPGGERPAGSDGGVRRAGSELVDDVSSDDEPEDDRPSQD